MANRPATTALAAALSNWRRHLVAVSLVVVAFAVATMFASSTAYYGAALVAFAVWMGWFVLTVVDLIGRADF
ncbi:MULTISPECIES: hypothetical protein [Halostella]|uniref:hypothetical protein n=1 Tax=Halostella TaxID=1843185 RepID=UPI001081C63E|nr:MULTISPECIES: hypothetical protein [Halostella]